MELDTVGKYPKLLDEVGILALVLKHKRNQKELNASRKVDLPLILRGWDTRCWDLFGCIGVDWIR